jgi:asparagine synthase (glutamine-hydrolysing)
MSRILRHRGPDDEGFLLWNGTANVRAGEDTPADVLNSDVRYTPVERLDPTTSRHGGVALGHRRLSIIDLSPRGHQPMRRDAGHWIVFNGEVYNFIELRHELNALGHRFESCSDTEVILAAYEQWGADCFSRFNGMWALAILDPARQRLVLSRDRFGVKPLYLLRDEQRIAFASEIKAFRAFKGHQWRVNEPRLLDFLVWNISDHSAETLFDGVEQLKAGHYATVDLSGLHGDSFDARVAYSSQAWYSLRDRVATQPGSSPDEFRAVLEDSIRLRLRADVPVGSCLSGGIDSSTIVCLLAHELQERNAIGNLRTFTAASADSGFDESSYARLVARHTGARSHTVTPLPDGLFDDLAELTWHQDEPFLTSSIFAQWCVFRLARQNGVVVMLDGQGADEILCGYRGYVGAYLASLMTRFRLGQWVRELGAIREQTGFGYSRLIGYTMAYAAPRLVRLLGHFDSRAYADSRWIRPSNRDVFRRDPLHALGGRSGSVVDMSIAQLMNTNLPMLLHWEDRNSMAFSVEARVPFLDYRVVELCVGLGDEWKIAGGVSKTVLRRRMRGVVPDAVLDRRDKMGFVTAEPMWTTRDRAPRFRAELADAIDAFPTILHPTIMTSFDDVVAGRRPFDFMYWRAISAGQWARTFSLS